MELTNNCFARRNLSLRLGIALLITLSQTVCAPSVRAQEKFPTLKAGSETYTNVVVTDKTATHLFFHHAAGDASVKLKDLPSEVQKQFGYNAAKAGEIEKSNKTYVPPADTITRDYGVPDSGVLRLTFPIGWKDTTMPTANGVQRSGTIRLEREGNPDFLVLISTIPNGHRLTPDNIVKTLEVSAQRSLPGSVEQKLELVAFKGPEATGSHFTLTDKNLVGRTPPPDDFIYQTQGVARVGDTAFSFTIFSNVVESKEARLALEMVKNARYIERQPLPR